MTRINLLPWRAERRKLRQKEFLTMLGLSALGGLLLWFAVNTYYNNQIEGQNARNQYVRDRIAEVDKQITEIEELDKQKAKLLARKKVIEELQANRSQMVHLFDSLVRTIPDGVTLTNLKQEGNKLTLEGRSQSNARVSTFMRNLEGSGWMTKPDLSIIEAKDGDPGLPYVFTLGVALANPNAPVDADGNGVPDTPAAAPATPDAGEAAAFAAASAQAKAAQQAPAPASPAPAATPSSAPAPAAGPPAPAAVPQSPPAQPPAPAAAPTNANAPEAATNAETP